MRISSWGVSLPQGFWAAMCRSIQDAPDQRSNASRWRLDMSVEQAAWAVVRLANSNMESAVRTVSLQRGYDPRTFTLLSFGGAGPLHAADIATGLGIDEVLVPPHPGVLAALGLTVPDLQRDYVRTVLTPVDVDALPRLGVAFVALGGESATRSGRRSVVRRAGHEHELSTLATWDSHSSFEYRTPMNPTFYVHGSRVAIKHGTA